MDQLFASVPQAMYRSYSNGLQGDAEETIDEYEKSVKNIYYYIRA